jgi:hypothetical protein
MISLFAPPELFSAYAFAEDGSDPDLRAGTHLRLFAGLGASFPLTPFAVFKLASRNSAPSGVHVTDREGHPMDKLDLSQIGVGEATLILNDNDTQRTVRVELELELDDQLDDPKLQVEGVVLLDQKNRVIAYRNTAIPYGDNKWRWPFSAPVLHKLRVRGSASQLGILTKSVAISDILGERPKPAVILGLPIQGQHSWYIGLQDRNDGLRRVERGAPLLLNPMDCPEGPFDTFSSEAEAARAEQARVEAMLISAQLGDGLENLLSKLVDDRPVPWAQREKKNIQTPGGQKRFVYASRLGTLQMAAIDPGLARFFGFADWIDDFPDLNGEGGWDTLAIVGLFAIAPQDFERRGLDLARLLCEPAPDTEGLIEVLVGALEPSSGRDMRREIAEIRARVRENGLVAAPFVTVVSPVPPWLPPSLRTPDIVQHRWQATADNSPSSLYRASFVFPRAPLASIIAMATRIGGNWKSRHDTVDVSGFRPPRRAKPLIFGHEQTASSRLRAPGRTSGTLESAGLLSDQDIPADAGPVTYRVRASNFFGRFGNSVDFPIEPPPRPAPPPPVLRFHIERMELTASDLASLDELPPGVLKLTVAVPRPKPAERFTEAEEERLGSVIVMPRLDDLAAGSLQLASLELRLGDQDPRSVDLSAPGFFAVEFPLPGLKPQETKTWRLTGKFKNTAGVTSEPATVPVEITDARPPQVYPSGIGLFWTSAPGPSPEVDLKLSWPATYKSRHRVYLTDQQGLGLTTDDIAEPRREAAPSRGRVAAVGCRKVLDHGHVDRRAFRLLTEQPEAGPDGRAVLETRLPRSLSTVQFLRVVPLGPDGAEPPFDSCGIVPVAVPDSRRPPAPRLDGEVDPATGTARLRVVADGFDRVALERDEPGLFTAGADGNEPPYFRIRRAVGAVADPIYARPIGHGPLALQDAAAPAPIFSATHTDDHAGRGLEPFVRYVYWAEVQLPPERRLPAGVAPLNPPGGVTPVDPAHAESHPRPMSLPSAPRVLMHIPPHAPAAPPPEAIAVSQRPANAAGNVEMTIEIADPPRAHAKAIGPYRLAVWSQWPGQGIEPITIANGARLEGTWPDFSEGAISVSVNRPASVDPASPLTLRLGFADPVGRLSDLTTISVPPPPPLPEPQLGPVQIDTARPIFNGILHRVMVVKWRILAPVWPDPPEQYALHAVVRELDLPLLPPLIIQTTLDQVPEVAGVQDLPPGQVMVLLNRFGRVQGTQQYFIFLQSGQEITVTLTDPLGRTATQTRTIGNIDHRGP